MCMPQERQPNCLLWYTFAYLYILHILNKCQLLEVTFLQITEKKKSPQGSILGAMASVQCVLPDREGQNPQFLKDWNIHGLQALARALWPVLPAAQLWIPCPNLLDPGQAQLGEQCPLWDEHSTAHGALTCSDYSAHPPEMLNGFLAICLSLGILSSKYRLWD